MQSTIIRNANNFLIDVNPIPPSRKLWSCPQDFLRGKVTVHPFLFSKAVQNFAVYFETINI